MTDPDERRIALGDELGVLLAAAGLSGRAFAKATGWQTSKVSRILNGKQAISDEDIRVWCETTGASAAEQERLRAELRSVRAREARWSRQLRAGHRAVQDDMSALEYQVNRIRSFDLALVPGLVQTAEYARVLFTALADLRETPYDTDEAVRARMQRQHVLYDSGKSIELLTSELTLRQPIGTTATMSAQLDRLLALEGLPTVRLGIVPLNVAVPVPPLHGFCILEDHVLVETLHREVSTDDPEDVAMYERTADALWSVAAVGEQARGIIHAVSADLAATRDEE